MEEVWFLFCSPKDPLSWCRGWAFNMGPGRGRRIRGMGLLKASR